jgi:hypothetical protein
VACSIQQVNEELIRKKVSSDFIRKSENVF